MGCIDGLVQERRNSNELAMELRLSYTNPLICGTRTIECVGVYLEHDARRCNIFMLNSFEETSVCPCISYNYSVFRFTLKTGKNMLNSNWPSDTIWRQRCGSTLAQVMAWCHQATSHYLSQCWPTSMLPLGHNESTFFDKCHRDVSPLFMPWSCADSSLYGMNVQTWCIITLW